MSLHKRCRVYIEDKSYEFCNSKHFNIDACPGDADVCTKGANVYIKNKSKVGLSIE